MVQVIEFYRQNLELAREKGERAREIDALGSLGRAYAALGDLDQARDCYEEALRLSRELGDSQRAGRLERHLQEILQPSPPEKEKKMPARKQSSRPRTRRKTPPDDSES